MAPEPVWQQLQKKTFTRYINGKLASKGLQINDLYEDVKDGKKESYIYPFCLFD